MRSLCNEDIAPVRSYCGNDGVLGHGPAGVRAAWPYVWVVDDWRSCFLAWSTAADAPNEPYELNEPYGQAERQLLDRHSASVWRPART